TAKTRDLPVVFNVQGHLVPLLQVDVRPQRSGIVREVHFREGEDVAAGQVLFTLDSTDLRAQLSRAEAQAAQIKAQLEDALRDYHRSKEMAKSRFIASSAVDTSASKAEALRAQHQATLADVESVRVQLSRTRIVAPMAGKAGALKVYQGSLAQEGSATPLVTLVQFDPIGVEFNLPEANLAAVVANRANGQLTVSLQSADGQELQGRLSFVNNTVNTNTGTISMKASFPNAKHSLWPGAFVRVTLVAGVNRGVIVLPPQAVIEGPSGHFVYAVSEASTVSVLPVTLLRIQEGMAVVSGIPVDAKVVLEGHQGLKSNAKVRIAADKPGRQAKGREL
ncbi:MAG: efflux RND transporter periplasmic adaptor subunit, partial [Proteobacteria bacterium]|nr:efflux RND transporter periplasmic adaptor subunit [Pseudomonadota bacterium]